MTVATIYPATTADDGVAWGSTWYSATNPFSDTVGQNRLGIYGGAKCFNGWRFQIPFPKNMSLNTVTLNFYVEAGQSSGSVPLYFYGDDVDNSAAFQQSARPDQRTHTSASAYKLVAPAEWATPGYKSIDITTIFAEWNSRNLVVPDNYFSVVTDSVSDYGGSQFVLVSDTTRGTNPPYIEIDYVAPVIGSGPATISDGETGVTFTGSFFDVVTSVTLINGTFSQVQTITAQSEPSLTITNVAGTVPYGNSTLRFSDGVVYTDFNIEFIPVSGHGYVVASNQATDSSSVGYGTSPATADGDVYEWDYENEVIESVPTDVWSITSRGGITRAAGSTNPTITFRRFSITAGEWSEYGTITFTAESSSGWLTKNLWWDAL